MIPTSRDSRDANSPAVLANRLAEHALRQAAAAPGLDPAIRAEIENLANTLRARPVFHVINFAELGWTIMHPLVGCGLDLFECPVNEAAELGVAFEFVGRYGRFRCGVDEDGFLDIGDEVSLPLDGSRECPGEPLAADAIDDGMHCECWYDGGACCRCKAPADPSVCKSCGASDCDGHGGAS